MFELFHLIVDYVLPFLIVFTVLVFVHELGHYLAAIRCGVLVQVFSVGIGPELFSWTDRQGTRWRFGALPIGGYVKMFGEMLPGAGEASHGGPGAADVPETRAFHKKTLAQRSFIVAAGPAANFIFAIVVLAGIYMVAGQSFTPAVVGTVVPGSAAERAGFEPGDEIVRIDGTSIERFEQVIRIVRLRPETPLEIAVMRQGREIVLPAVPDAVSQPDSNGNPQMFGRLGISRSTEESRVVRHDPASAVWRAINQTGVITASIFTTLGQIVKGTRGTEELGGPIRIAQFSGEVWQAGFMGVLIFSVMLSINLGLINLFPIPMLDGGFLLFYGIEALRGRPLGAKAQEYGFLFGVGTVILLMLFVTWNDLVQLRLIDYLVGLVT